jgi:hypothetical protein
LVKIRKWIESRIKKPETEYDEAKREIEMAIGRPYIRIRVEIPKGFEDLRAEFLDLEKDQDFLMEVEDLVKKRLVYAEHGFKNTH